MLHCLVFKEQLFVFRSLPSFEMLCFKRLIYCTASLLDCQELFYFSFLSERRPSCMTCKCFHSRNVVSHLVLAGISRRLVLYYRSCAHLSTAFPKKITKIPHHHRASRLYGECGIPASILHDLTCGSDCKSPTRRVQSSRRRTFRVSLSVDDDIVISLGDLVVAARRAATLKVAHNGRACARAELGQ